MLRPFSSLHSVCPFLTTKIYVLTSMRRFVSTSTEKRNDHTLSPTVNYNSVQTTNFEQNRKEVNVGWRKLLDMELHELYRLIDTLRTKWRATVTIGTEPTDSIEEKRKAKTWEDYRTTMLDRKSALVSALLDELKCDIFELAMYSTEPTRSSPCDRWATWWKTTRARHYV